MRRSIAFIFAIFLTSLAWADVIVLTNGTRLEGDLKKTPKGWQITTADGKTLDIAAADVKSIEVGPGAGAGTPQRAMQDLASLRRSVEALSDLKDIVARFQRFIEQNKTAPAAEDAKKDLATWQDRLDRGLVKLGSRWILPEERTQYADKALLLADQARQLVMTGRNHDADAAISEALENDPQCAPAIYLRGVVQFQNNQLPAARKSFEAVNAIIKDHAPSLNNVAVIMWRQNAVMPALATYEKSIRASPVNKYLLDNVAEALAAVPGDQRKNRVAESLYRKFAEQDARLQEALAAQGLYRWGGIWLSKEQMEKLRDVEKQVREKMSAAKTKADEAEKRVRDLDAQLDQIGRALRAIEAQSVYRNPDGKIVRLPYPPAYYDLRNDDSRVRGERTNTVVKYEAAQREQQQLERELPKPEFRGIQQLVGAEGTPVMILPPSTAPSESNDEK